MKNKLSSPGKGSKKIKTDIRSFFTPQPQSKNPNGLNWEFKDNKSLLIGINKEIPKFNKIAAFDMDGTLIKVNGKHVHPKDEFDWVWLYPNVTKLLNEYYAEKEYSIVIISNQGGLDPDKAKGEARARQIKQKLSLMAKDLNIPFIFLASTRKDIYRKPRTGMWEHLAKLIPNIGTLLLTKLDSLSLYADLDKESSFYIGDASGRQDNWAPGVKADHADTDRKFALNLGIKFQVPEEFFQNHDPIPYTLKGFCPFTFQKTSTILKTNIDELLQPIFDNQPNLVMLIGLPGSGKSSIVENYFESKGYASVNQDTLKTKNKCIKVCETNLEQGNSVIIDNTNTTKSNRASYLSIAKKSDIKCYAVLINPDLDLCEHNSNVRSLLPNSNHTHIPQFVIKMQHDKYEAPAEAEGFKQIIQVPFIPKFQSEYHELIWNSYTY